MNGATTKSPFAMPRTSEPLRDRWCRGVIRVADMVSPGGTVAFRVDVEHRDVSHEARRRGAMPVVLARLEEHTVAGADDLDRPAATLGQADAFGDEDGLAVGMRVPRRAGPRREVDAARGEARRIGRRRKRVHVHRSRKPLARPLCRLHVSTPRDLHRHRMHRLDWGRETTPNLYAPADERTETKLQENYSATSS